MFGNPFKTVCFHQVNGFDHLTLGATGMVSNEQLGPARIYIERSYFGGDIVCICNSTDQSALPWYREVDIAPKEVIEIPHACMFDGLKKEPAIMDYLRARLSNGSRVQFFRPTQLEVELIQNLGLKWEDTLSSDPAIAESFYKADLRRIGEKIGKNDAFVPYEILTANWQPSDVRAAAARVSLRAKFMGMRQVLIRRADLASGDGNCIWGEDDLDLFMEANQGHELLVEVLLTPHIPISNVWWIRDGEIHYGWATKLLQDGFKHRGNVIASDDRVHNFVGRTKALSLPFVRYALEVGYNGMLNFDFMYSPVTKECYIAELNARVPASLYARGLADKLHFKTWAVAFRVIEPSETQKSFGQIHETLGRDIFQPDIQHGIVPYMLSGLSLPQGQRRLGIMSVANHPDTAELMLDRAEVLLVA
jgi:hypothetical protein